MSDVMSPVDMSLEDVIDEQALGQSDGFLPAEIIRNTRIKLDARRRLERCLEDRQLAKDLREFNFDI